MTRLPNLISYSPIVIPLTSGSPPIILPRRDLFDARYQLIAEEDPVDATSEGERNKAALDFIEAPSDLVKGVYEGGLKTWECSGDLVEYLEGLKQSDAAFTFWGKSCLEVRSSQVRAALFLITCTLDWMWDCTSVMLHLPHALP